MASKSALETSINLLKLLSHRIRTPLTVISNDLAYFKTLLPNPQDCDRAISRCWQISDIFKSSESLCIEQGHSTQVCTLFIQVFGDRFRFDQNFESCIQSNNFKQALVWLDKLLQISLVEMPTTGVFRFSLATDSNVDVKNDFSSVIELFSLVSEEESILAILIDAILNDSNIRVEKRSHNSFELIFA
jgi:hypothetical protein